MNKTVEDYRNEIQLQPNNHNLYYYLGKALAEKGKYEEAVDSYNKVVELHPQSAWGYCGLGNALYAQNKWQEAIENYKKAIDIKPDVPPIIYRNLGRSFEKKGDIDNAIICFQKEQELSQIKIGDNNTHKKAQLNEEIQKFQQQIKEDSQNDSAYCSIGDAFFELENWKSALTNYQKALVITTNLSKDIYRKCAISLQKTGAIDEAIKLFKQVISQHPGDHSLYLDLGKMLCQQQQAKYTRAAIIAYCRSLKLNSKQPYEVYKELEDLLWKHQQDYIQYQGHIEYKKIIYHAHSRGGLCNRLRALSSCMSFSHFLEIPMEMSWLPAPACDCYFEDIYQPVCPVIKVEDILSKIENNPLEVLYITDMGMNIQAYYQKYIENEVKYNSYRQVYSNSIKKLTLQADLQKNIEQFMSNFWTDSIVGVHVRRTDHVSHFAKRPDVASKLSTNKGFFRKMRQQIDLGVDKFFLATDDSNTKKLFENEFPGKIISYCDQFNDSLLRQTSIQDAAIDLFLLSRTKKIIGSYNSSFSVYASYLGGIPLETA